MTKTQKLAGGHTHIRIGQVIKEVATGKSERYTSINKAKKASRCFSAGALRKVPTKSTARNNVPMNQGCRELRAGLGLFR